jgi:predicted nuclease of predicted toxin-antitoxin system
MLKFLIDTQLPPLLAEFFRYKGFDAVHTTDYQDGHLFQDEEISQRAIAEERIIVTKDNDFLNIYLLGKYDIEVLILEVGNIRNKELLELISMQLDSIIDLFKQKNKLVILQENNLIAY